MTRSLDDQLTQPWEILSEATPSRAPEVAVKPKFLQWYEMMTSARPNSDGGGAKACEVTRYIVKCVVTQNNVPSGLGKVRSWGQLTPRKG